MDKNKVELEMHECILVLEGETVSGDHEGYCSGEECEDTVTTDQHYVILKCVSEKTIDHLRYLKFKDMLDELFNEPIGFYYTVYGLGDDSGRGSGFCRSSSSGRHHDSDFTAKRIINVLYKTPQNVLNVDSGWPSATINETEIDKLVTIQNIE